MDIITFFDERFTSGCENSLAEGMCLGQWVVLGAKILMWTYFIFFYFVGYQIDGLWISPI